jgi:hypothetical protein
VAVPRLALLAVLALGLTACSSSKDSKSATSTSTHPAKSPIVVKLPLASTQWRSPLTVKGTSTLDETLKVEVQDLSGKQLGSKDAPVSDGRFSVKVPFAVKKLMPGTVSVHDESGDHTVLVNVVLTP